MRMFIAVLALAAAGVAPVASQGAPPGAPATQATADVRMIHVGESRPTVSSTELVERINGGRSGYRSALIGSALIIRPPDHRAEYLAAPTPLGAVRVVGLMPALRTLFHPLDSRLTNGGAVVSITH